MLVSSPRTWGCFFRAVPCAKPHYSLPHARGGVSSFHSLHFFSGWSSPRTWGCFSDIRPRESNRVVFPTHVGVFLPDTSPYWSCSGSSPRTWGCFPLFLCCATAMLVFPTHVGVFLRSGAFHHPTDGLPHARGGVSCRDRVRRYPTRSSPRTWGCFSWWRNDTVSAAVFPTHVGVFLS